MKPLIVVAILLLLSTVITTQVTAPPVVTVIGSTVSAVGRWKSTTGNAGDEVAFKHIVRIDCFEGHTCVEATASILHGEPNIGIQHYEIVKRDESGLVAENSAPECVTTRLIINFQDRSVLAIDEPKTGAKSFHDICQDKAINRTKTYQLVAR